MIVIRMIVHEGHLRRGGFVLVLGRLLIDLGLEDQRNGAELLDRGDDQRPVQVSRGRDRLGHYGDRLTPFAEVLLAELGQGTVDWEPNFDGTLHEPAILPARLPHVLLNGATGIAVGMATDIPPHNLREVVDACIHLMEHPAATVEQLCAYIQGPDFPGGGIVVGEEAIREYLANGKSRLIVRGVVKLEEGPRQKSLVISELPPLSKALNWSRSAWLRSTR